MKIVHVSYARINTYSNPVAWLQKIDFFTGIVDAMTSEAQVTSIHCIDHTGILKQNNATYHFFKCSPLETLFPARIHKLIRTLKPDAVIVHGLGFSWQVIQLAYTLEGETRLYLQNHAEKPLRFHKALLQRWADRKIDGYFFTAAKLARPWIDQRQIRSSAKVHEVMEVSSTFHPIDPAEARSRTSVTEPLSFLWVGRLDANKDPLTVVKAFIKFIRGENAAKLYMVFQENDLLHDVQQLIHAHPREKEQIVLVGQVEHGALLHWYNSVNFIISTSHYEGSGVAVCEAMSCGCIPVLTDIPSFNMMTGNGACGLLFKPGNVYDLAIKLISCTTLDIPKEKEKVLEHFQRTLSFQAIASKMIQAIGA
jgi:glycosyltransferase involved in cell wall biosynthesis